MGEILFSGAGPVQQGADQPDLLQQVSDSSDPQGETVARAVPRPLGIEILEAAFAQLTSTPEGRELYGDPQRGATLEQSWRTFGLLTGVRPVCLLASGRPEVPTSAIERVILFSPTALVDLLAHALSTLETKATAVNVYDGRSGHCINLLAADEDLILYHDPWPGRSLLCRENNVAGVDAVEHENGWIITRADLAEVIFAAFLWPSDWGDLSGEPTRVPYEDLQGGDFFGFFHVREVEGGRTTEAGRTSLRLKTGGFQEYVDLAFDLDSRDRVSCAELWLSRVWMANLNPFARDIAKSFLAGLVTERSREPVAPIVELLWSLGGLDEATADRVLRDDAPEYGIVRAYLGVEEQAFAPLATETVRAENVTRGDADWFKLTITFW
ncbi:hypothetical protein ADL00_05065 [Streptomyces sp. AS58]|uniref:hypothetical protein n=1 Tax=Streptomyces sp. AS58 TaxID=1519489 RepID=UPI0006AEE792|nr:hypothetical protein [Streptomyces sp. AS58]KOV72872.1 hypothetical protein ADL00_05065 [Streptomyces sp. AS58]